MVPVRPTRTQIRPASQGACRLLAAATGLAVSVTAAGTATGVSAAASQLAPHRAVYELSLERATHASGVAALSGRMVFEFSGNACDGYTQNMRLVTRMTDREGKPSISDLRTSSWEDGQGERFRFSTSTYRNHRLNALVVGDAKRDADETVTVNLIKPKAGTVELAAMPLFPVQHSRALLAAAVAGRRTMSAPLYDGSDDGAAYYETATFIGGRYAAGAQTDLRRLEGADRLDEHASWPVAISYYEPDKPVGEGLPDYEMMFRFYANGVARQLLIDYGNFAIRGALSALEFIDATDCDRPG